MDFRLVSDSPVSDPCLPVVGLGWSHVCCKSQIVDGTCGSMFRRILDVLSSCYRAYPEIIDRKLPKRDACELWLCSTWKVRTVTMKPIKGFTIYFTDPPYIYRIWIIVVETPGWCVVKLAVRLEGANTAVFIRSSFDFIRVHDYFRYHFQSRHIKARSQHFRKTSSTSIVAMNLRKITRWKSTRIAWIAFAGLRSFPDPLALSSFIRSWRWSTSACKDART
jgi:hypothetical protein